MKKLTEKYFESYLAMLDVNIEEAFIQIKEREWTVESFRFYTAVSAWIQKVMARYAAIFFAICNGKNTL